MEPSQLIAHCGSRKLTRAELTAIPTPEGTSTHRPVPHHEIVGGLAETLSFRHIGVVRDEYAVSEDGMKMFGVLDLETSFDGCRFSIGVRNSNDKSMRLALTVGYRVFVCDNMAFRGDFTPVLAKHSKHFSLVDALSVGVDRMQRHFEPMRRQVEAWKASKFTRPAPSSLYIERSSKRSWTLRSTWRAKSTTSTSTRSSRTLCRARCGACPTPSPRPSRNWTRYRSSRPPRNSERFWRPPRGTARQARRRRLALQRNRSCNQGWPPPSDKTAVLSLAAYPKKIKAVSHDPSQTHRKEKKRHEHCGSDRSTEKDGNR